MTGHTRLYLTVPLVTSLCLTLAITGLPCPVHATPEGRDPQLDTLLKSGRVQLGEASAATHWASLRLPATVSASPRAHWDLAPHTDGHLVHWRVNLGDLVEEGDELAEVAPYAVIDLKAKVSSLKRIASARGNLYYSLKKQVRSGALARAQLDEALASWQEAKANLSEAKAALSARAQHAAQPTVWRSPMSGVITDLKCAPGAHLDAGAACVTISDPSQRTLTIEAPYAALARFKQGARGRWRARSVSVEPREIPLTLSLLVPPHERGGRVGQAFLSPDEGSELPPTGEVGEVELYAKAPEGAVWVPRSALVEWAGRARVFIHRGGRLTALEVDRLGELDGGVVVFAEPLEVGVEVVTQGAFLLKSRALLGEE